MKRNRRQSKSRVGYEKLEDKVLLAITAVVNANGTLNVEGVALGPVEIVSPQDGRPEQFIISERGEEVAAVVGVTRNINIDIAFGDLDDSVLVDLQDEVVRTVNVNVGEGDNDFTITGNQEIERVIYRGGDGDDNACLLYTSPSPRDATLSRMPSSA